MANSYSSWRTGPQIDNIYPVGSIYMSVSSTNPGSLFGGTWEQIQDKFLLCAGSTYTAGTTGGAASHTHTLSAHTHEIPALTSGGPSNNTSGATTLTTAMIPAHTHGSKTLTGQARWRDFNMNDHNGLLSASGICSTAHNVSWSGTHDKFAVAGSQGTNYYNDLNITATHEHTSVGGGGSHTHTLSSHTHSTTATNTGTPSSDATNSKSNLPPYLAVYVFKRIS